jgi:uncharacterized iron-regulated membrane protein
MSIHRVLAGLLLIVAMVSGFMVWRQTEFLYGALTFVGVAVAAGVLHNKGDREAARAKLKDR